MNKGFTLVELLVSIFIIGLVLTLTIPSYLYVYKSTKEANYKNKVVLIKQRAVDYGESIKDEIQELSQKSPSECKEEKISNLIKKGYIKSDYTNKDALTNPMNNQEFDDDLSICYCKSDNSLRTFMVSDFDIDKEYYKGEEVKYNGMIYECVSSYNYKAILNDMEANQNKQKESRDPNTGEARYVAADCQGYFNGEINICIKKGTTIDNSFVINNFFKKIEC